MELSILDPAAGTSVLDAARAGIRAPKGLDQFVHPFHRECNLQVLESIVNDCMQRFNNQIAKSRVESDSWLGSRVHAAVRLTRVEAATPGLWEFLACYAFPDYVRWRWGDVYSRFTVPDIKKQAFKRLWWGAELFRNGAKYDTASQALAISDVPNTYLSLRNVHNRGVALALLRYIQEFEIGSRQANPLSTQLKTSSVTVALDRAWPARDDGSTLDSAWLSQEVDGREVLLSPIGPQDGFVSDEQLNAVYAALVSVIDLPRVKAYRREQDREREPAEEE